MATLASASPNPPMEVDETIIVRRAQQGETEAYEELVRRHQRKVFAVASGILRQREEAEDVAQQVLLKVYVSLPRFDRRSAFSTWLYRITVNECWDHLRWRKSRPQVLQSELSEEQTRKVESLAGDGGFANPAERALQGDLVEGLLAQLSEEDQRILVLKEVEGFSVREIGDILRLNVNTVKVRLFRARAHLMQFRARAGRSHAKRRKG
jgi:RNA polymerase sigma-70 factor (ECF subfamily)